VNASRPSDALPLSTSWWDLITRRADLTPDRVFLSDEAGRSLTFGGYRDRAERTAAGLLDLGVRRDHVVSWQLPTTLEASVLMAALARLGVRQNPIIPILRRSEVSLIVEQVGTDWLVMPGTYRGFDHVAMANDISHEIADKTGSTTRITVIDSSSIDMRDGLRLPDGDPSRLPAVGDPEGAERWYFYSSGTTAMAKGARHTDSSVMASSNPQVEYLRIESDDVFALPFPITHIGGIMLLTGYLRVGARLFFVETFDPVRSPIAMAEHGVTIYGTATPFFHAYLAAQKAHGDEPLFGTLRQLQAGGAPITPELNAECERVFGSPIFNQWGLTEFPAATSLGVDDPATAFNGTVGRLAPGCEVKVVGLDGVVRGLGEEGELWLRGPQRCLGYVDASLDEHSFDGDGFFRTGDVGTVDADGFVRLTGRVKDIIIRNAENLSALEIEECVITHPSIADVAVIGLPDQVTGERACAVVVMLPGHEAVTVADLAAHCGAAGLAKQKFPERVEIVESLPRNPMGKVLKHELRSRYRGLS